MVRNICLLYFIRLGLGCPRSLKSLYGPTFHATPIDSRIVFQYKLYMSCVMFFGNKLQSLYTSDILLQTHANDVNIATVHTTEISSPLRKNSAALTPVGD